jgi:hypothetical protein
MPTMLSKLYHALLDAGVDDPTATAAAEEAAQGDARFVELRLQLEPRFGDMEPRFGEVRVDVAQLRGEMRVLVWQSRLTLGVIIALVLYALKQVFAL